VPSAPHPQASPPGLAALCGLDDPVRRRLYDYICGAGEAADRDTAAAATGIGRPLAAYHLDKLVELGLLTADYRRRAGRRGGPGAGRPAKVYARSLSEFSVSVPPREYELAARLLAAAVESDHSGAAMAALTGAARQLGVEIGMSAAPHAVPDHGAADDLSGPDLAAAVTSVLRAHGFEPTLDSSDRIGLRNCPFRRLAAEHTEVVCTMNLALISGVLSGLGASELDAVLTPAPGRCCVVIRSRAVAADLPSQLI